MLPVIFIFFICRLGASLAVLTPVSGQVFSYLSWSFSVSEAGSLTPKRLHHLPIDVHDRYGRLPTMPFFVSEPGAIPSNHDQLLGAPLSENAVRCTRNSTLFFSIKGLWYAMSFVMKLLSERIFDKKPCREIQSNCGVPSCSAASRSPLEVIAVMTRVRIQDPFPRRKKRHEILEAQNASSIMMMSNTVSSMATKRREFVSRMGLITWRGMLIEHSAWACEDAAADGLEYVHSWDHPRVWFYTGVLRDR